MLVYSPSAGERHGAACMRLYDSHHGVCFAGGRFPFPWYRQLRERSPRCYREHTLSWNSKSAPVDSARVPVGIPAPTLSTCNPHPSGKPFNGWTQIEEPLRSLREASTMATLAILERV